MSDKLKWGLIGASNIAKEWLTAAINAHPNCEVVSVLSSNAERGESYVEELGLNSSHTDLDTFLNSDELDAVYISTTNEKHHQQLLASVAAGKHVLCEKPLSLTVQEAEEMLAAAEEAGVVFATNHHIRNMETLREMRRILVDGELGKVVSGRLSFTVQLPEHLARWRMNDPTAGAGVMLDLTVHDVDTMRYLMGADPVRVTGFGGTAGDASAGIFDNTMTVWEFSGDVYITCMDSFLVPHGGTAIELHGTKGSILGREVLWQEPQGDVKVTTDAGSRIISVDHKNPYLRTVSDFVDAVSGNGVPSATGMDGLKSLKYTLAAQKAITTGTAVEL